MKRVLIISFILSLYTLQSIAQGSAVDRSELQNLLQERKQKFDAYNSSLEKKSGIFGNKTKNDVLKSNEVLAEIVRTDNHIISVLNRVVDFRNFEKVNMNYGIKDRDEKLDNLTNVVTVLNKQLDVLAISNAALKSKTRRLHWMVYIVSFFLLLTLFAVWKKRK